nr:glycosyltransferase [Massilia varians]
MVLNYNSYVDTIQYVSVLRKQKKVNLRILIVDNCSPNGSFEKLSSEFDGANDVTVIKSERNGGYAYGNNFGLRFIRNWPVDYIIISNNDIGINNPDLISGLVSAYATLADPGFVSGVAHTNGVPAKYPAWRMPTLRDDIIGSLRCLEMFSRNTPAYRTGSTDGAAVVDCLPGCFFLGSKEVFYRIDLMDENTFLYMEEVILAHKVKTAGLKNYLINSLNYEHAGSKTISSLLSMNKMRGHLINSRVYYHKAYLNTSGVGIAAIKLLFHAWKLENVLYSGLKSIFSRGKGAKAH